MEMTESKLVNNVAVGPSFIFADSTGVLTTDNFRTECTDSNTSSRNICIGLHADIGNYCHRNLVVGVESVVHKGDENIVFGSKNQVTGNRNLVLGNNKIVVGDDKV